MEVVTSAKTTKPRIALLVLGVIGVLVFIYCAIAYWRASVVFVGREFSPYSFNIRTFRYIPKIKTDNEPSSLVCPLEISKHLSNSTIASGVDRWDVVSFRKGFANFDSRGEAAILIEALGDQKQVPGHGWEDWSSKNPKLAAFLWPAVQQLAIHRAYFAIPELLETSRTCSTEKAIQSAIEKVSIQAAIDQANRLRGETRAAEALAVVRWGKTVGQAEQLDQLESSLIGDSK
jgi:hypothetical protein